jgi:hypothetical protein
VVCLVIGFVTPLLLNAIFPPFAKWVFFPTPASQNTTQYTVYVVDSAGIEYDYPREAAPPGRVDHRGALMATEYTTAEQQAMAAFLLQRAQSHKGRLVAGLGPIKDRTVLSSLPRLLGRDKWTTPQARSMDRLVGIRVYKTTINTSKTSVGIAEQSRSLVYQYNTTS